MIHLGPSKDMMDSANSNVRVSGQFPPHAGIKTDLYSWQLSPQAEAESLLEKLIQAENLPFGAFGRE